MRERLIKTAGIIILMLIVSVSQRAHSEIQILKPSSYDTLIILKPNLIQWEQQTKPVNLYYSTNYGRKWILIKDSLTTNTYNWTPPKIDSVEVQLRVSWRTVTKPYLIWEMKNSVRAKVREFSVDVSSDGKLLLTASQDDRIIKLWNIEKKTVIDSINIVDYGVVFSANFFHNPDSVIIAVDNTVLLWTRDDKQLRALTGDFFTNEVKQCTPHPTRNIFAAGCMDGNVGVFNLDSQIPIKKYISADSCPIYTVHFTEDGKKLSYAGEYRKLFIADWEEEKEPLVFTGDGEAGINAVIWDCNISSNNNFALSGGVDSRVRLWDIQDIDLNWTSRTHTFHVRKVCFSPDGRMMLSGSLDGSVRQRNLEEGYEYDARIDHGGQVLAAGYFATRDTVYSAGRDNTIRLWRNFDEAFDMGKVQCKIIYPVDCDESKFDFQEFTGSEDISFVGGVYNYKNSIQLNRLEKKDAGAMWYNKRVPVAKGFKTEFSFKLSNGNGSTNPDSYNGGGDGFAFVIQDMTTNSIGYNGYSLGYGGMQNCLAVEFDTFKNDTSKSNLMHDPAKNHIAVQCNGIYENTSDNVPPVNLGITLNIIPLIPNGQIYYCRIDYNIKPNALRIYLDTVQTMTEPVLVIDSLFLNQKLSLSNNMRAYVGFTAGTGDTWENHEILSWSLCPFPEYGTISSRDEVVPDDLRASPNPIRTSTLIDYYCAITDVYDVIIYDISGNQKLQVYSGMLEKGTHNFKVDFSDLVSGIYFCVVKSEKKESRIKLLLIK
jgi:WD40 repeat protein